MWRFRTEMSPGDIVVASDGYHRFRAVGEVTGHYEFRRHPAGFHHRRAVRWHWHVREREGDPGGRVQGGAAPVAPHLPDDPGKSRWTGPVLCAVSATSAERSLTYWSSTRSTAPTSPRSSGELITLLEDDKREGAENEIAVSLPYSGDRPRDRFTLPANLYILGTMNTADRSIALLDTALRRRFHFEEMAPQPDLLLAAEAKRTGVDLPRVLHAMNERLEYLVDRDHLIGHAWLMEASTRDDVDTAMRRKVIPLIAEYFYDDWSKVRSVLGGTDHFVERQRLGTPPGLESDMGEARYRWSVRETFAEDAYDHLVRAPVPDEASE